MLTYTNQKKKRKQNKKGKEEETPFYTVNNAMYPWHNQKRQCKSNSMISLFSG